jgi:GTP-binding protein
VTTVQLNRWLQEQLAGDPTAPPPRGAFRLFYGTQTGVHPPSFLLFCNDPRRAHFSVRRQIDNSLRERFGFGSAPIRLTLRSRRD